MSEEVIKTDFNFKFTNEAAMNTALAPFFYQPQVQSVDGDGILQFDSETGDPIMENDGDAYLVTHSESHAFDIIGTIYKPTGATLTDSEGDEYPEMAAESGWHVNLRIVGDVRRVDAEALDTTYGVNPVTPYRVWA